MEDKEAKRDIIATFRKMCELAQPDLRQYYRMTRKGKIVGAYAADGEYFADVQPLRNDGSQDPSEPVVPRVALPVQWGGADRGVVCPPAPGTMCDLSYYDGDPNYPFISGIRYGLGQNAPKAELNEYVIQLEPGVEIRIDKEKKIVMLTPQEANSEIGKAWTIRAGELARIEAPQIILQGNVTTQGGDGGKSTVQATADSTHTGNMTINGNFTVNGDISCTGTSYAAQRSGAPI